MRHSRCMSNANLRSGHTLLVHCKCTVYTYTKIYYNISTFSAAF